MVIKYKSKSIAFHSPVIFSILLILFGLLAICVSYAFPNEFTQKNPNFIYVWLYSSSIILFLGIFMVIYQRRNLIIFDLEQNKILISELLGGQKHSFSISLDKVKAFNLFCKQNIGKSNKNLKFELYIVDKNNNSLILGEIKQNQNILPFLELLATKYDKKVNIFSSDKNRFNFKIFNIEVHYEIPASFWDKEKMIFEENFLFKESEKGFNCEAKDDAVDRISWNFRKQFLLALINTFLAGGLVLLFAMVIIPIKGYTFGISFGIFTAVFYFLASVIMLLYSFFASSSLYFGTENITFEINLFNSILFHQSISRTKLFYMEGSMDSIKRNEIVLLSKEGFKLLYNQFESSGRPSEKMLQENILIIDTRPLLSAQRYFLQRKLYKLIK